MAQFTLDDISREVLAGLPLLTLREYVVVGQSVQAGAIVPEGAVIGVQITPIGQVSIGDLVASLPAEIASMKVSDFDHLITVQPELITMAGDPAVLTDPVKRATFMDIANRAAGRTLVTETNAEAMMRVIKRVRR
jgi:hypothetical protein